MNRLLTGLFCLLLLACSFPALAAKTDTVVLKNGDKITGDVKGLLRGKLEFSTNSMGTVYIEWTDIQAVISGTSQTVELANGQRFFGPLRKAEGSEMVAIETEKGMVGVDTMDVFAMYPVESGFWKRLDFKAIFGFSWDKASDVGNYNLRFDSEYLTAGHITQLSLFSSLTTQSDRDDTSRASADLTHIRLRPNKRFVNYFANIESNDELGIDLRTLGGIGYGWIPIRSNNNMVLLTAGVNVNHEIPESGDSQTNLEGVGRATYEFFKYTDPERSFNTTLTLFPSFTDWGRWRLTFDTDLDIEFYKDFSWILSLYAKYDTDPLTEDASKSDYGVRSSIAYTW